LLSCGVHGTILVFVSFSDLFIMFEPYYSLLPPHWVYLEDREVYYNEFFKEEMVEHPITIFMNARRAVLNPPPNDPIGIEIERLQYVAQVAEVDPSNPPAEHEKPGPSTEGSDDFGLDEDRNTFEPDATSKDEAVNQNSDIERIPDMDLPTGKYYEYHCQWSERDLFGKVNLYGLTFRYYEESHKTLIKFDGLVGEWVYSVIQGPYGPLEHIDFFIGAKIKVFGRTVTISSASGSAVRWIEAQRKKLEKQQERFREKIMAVGGVPCVKPKPKDVVRNITRGDGAEPGHTDLRKVLQLNAKLGEQLVSLGLCDQL
jgi:hypothetical protein